MLGLSKRVSRLDVGLAMSFVGVGYLVWALVAGVSRNLVQQFINSPTLTGGRMPALTHAVKIFFVDAGVVIDVVGVAWLIASLVLVVLSSRQKISISWAWAVAIGQVLAAALGSVLVGWATFMPYMVPVADPEQSPLAKVSSVSLAVIVPIAIVVWVTCLVWLLVEQARFDRHGPTLRDGLHTNVFR